MCLCVCEGDRGTENTNAISKWEGCNLCACLCCFAFLFVSVGVCVCVHATLIVFMCMYKTLRNSEALKQKT